MTGPSFFRKASTAYTVSWCSRGVCNAARALRYRLQVSSSGGIGRRGSFPWDAKVRAGAGSSTNFVVVVAIAGDGQATVTGQSWWMSFIGASLVARSRVVHDQTPLRTENIKRSTMAKQQAASAIRQTACMACRGSSRTLCSPVRVLPLTPNRRNERIPC